MRNLLALLVFICLLGNSVLGQSTGSALLGFSSASSVDQRALEKNFDSYLNPNNLRD